MPAAASTTTTTTTPPVMVMDETPEQIAESLHAFDACVAAVPLAQKTHLVQATTHCPALLTDALKLAFLRTEVWNVSLAVERYCVYWKLRVQLFGPTKAFLPLTLQGAMKDDLETLRYGFIRTVKGYGRILYIDPSRTSSSSSSSNALKEQPPKPLDVDSIARCLWYTATKALLSNTEMQRTGAIFVLDLNHSMRSLDRGLVQRLAETTNFGFPLRCATCCIVHAPPLAHAFVKVAKLFLRQKVRHKIHVVKSAATKLEAYAGIRADVLLSSSSNDDDTNTTVLDHEGWLLEMGRLEQEEEAASSSLVPSGMGKENVCARSMEQGSVVKASTTITTTGTPLASC